MKLTWQQFKTAVDQKGLVIYYAEIDGDIFLKSRFGVFELTCDLPKIDTILGIDRLEFETHYKPKALSKYEGVEELLASIRAGVGAIKPPALSELAEVNKSLKSVDSKTRGYPNAYSAGIQAFSAANAATDIFNICGSQSKVIRVVRLEVSLTTDLPLSASSTIEVLLVRRSIPNSGGTATVISACRHDFIDGPATAVAKYYTANPSTLGTLVGIIRCSKVTINSINSTQQVPQVIWDYRSNPIVLRSPRESFSVNLNGATIVTDSHAVNIEWEETDE